MNNSHNEKFRLPPDVISGINYVEQERQEINSKGINYNFHIIFATLVFFAVILVFAGLKALTGSGLFDGLLAPWIGLGPFYLVYLVRKQKKQNKKMQDYHGVYLQEVMIPLLKYLNPQFTYNRHGSIFAHNKAVFKERFATTSVHKAEDLVEGEIDGISIRFGEVEVLGDDDYEKFLCFVADFNKNINSTTILASKFKAPFPLKRKGMKKIQLDNPTINKKYWIYTSDEIEARYILTPHFMEQILAANLSGYYLFQDNKMLFLGDIGVDLFDMDADTDIYDQTLKTATALKQLLHLVEMFNLNSRVWK